MISDEGQVVATLQSRKFLLLHRPELDRDPNSAADFTGSGLCEPGCEGCAVLAHFDEYEALLAAHREEFLDECRAHGDEAAAQACLRDFETEARRAALDTGGSAASTI